MNVDYARFTEVEWACLNAALMAPALWPFQLMVAAIGFGAAVEACRTRELPSRVLMLFEACAYNPACLPLYDQLRFLLVGIRCHAARVTRGHRTESLQTVARRVGVSFDEAQRGVEALQFFGCDVRGMFRIWGQRADGGERTLGTNKIA
mgnify:CR=1 FL=1